MSWVAPRFRPGRPAAGDASALGSLGNVLSSPIFGQQRTGALSLPARAKDFRTCTTSLEHRFNRRREQALTLRVLVAEEAEVSTVVEASVAAFLTTLAASPAASSATP